MILQEGEQAELTHIHKNWFLSIFKVRGKNIFFSQWLSWVWYELSGKCTQVKDYTWRAKTPQTFFIGRCLVFSHLTLHIEEFGFNIKIAKTCPPVWQEISICLNKKVRKKSRIINFDFKKNFRYENNFCPRRCNLSCGISQYQFVQDVTKVSHVDLSPANWLSFLLACKIIQVWAAKHNTASLPAVSNTMSDQFRTSQTEEESW